MKYVVSVFKKGEGTKTLSSWECWAYEMDKVREDVKIMGKKLKADLVIQFTPCTFFEDVPYEEKSLWNFEEET